MENRKQPQASDYAYTLISIMVNRLIGHYGFTQDDREDLERDLLLAVLEADEHWDPSRAQRNTFDNRVVIRKIASIIRHRTQECRDYRRCRESLDDLIQSDRGTVVRRGDLLTEGADRRRNDVRAESSRIDLESDISALLNALDSELQVLCRFLMDGSKARAARILGVSKPTVFDRVGAIRERFAERGLAGYVQADLYGSAADGVCDE